MWSLETFVGYCLVLLAPSGTSACDTLPAVASLPADELNTASSLLEITLAYSLPLRFAKLSMIASHNSPGCKTVLLPTWSSDIVLIPIGGVCV